MNRQELEKEIEMLEGQLTGDMFKDMDTKTQIHQLKMKLNNTEPGANSDFECVGCGS